jgi:hypothetical protein
MHEPIFHTAATLASIVIVKSSETAGLSAKLVLIPRPR